MTFVCTWIVAPLPSSVVGDVLASLPLLAQLLALTQAGDPGRLLLEAAAAAVLPGLVLQENVLGAGAVVVAQAVVDWVPRQLHQTEDSTGPPASYSGRTKVDFLARTGFQS